MLESEEIEFLAEKNLIEIVPHFNSNIIHFIAGDVGPFKSGITSSVPLWFAINLKQQQKCTILPPHWLQIDVLEDLLHLEKTEKKFMKVPSEHYMIEAKILLSHASDNIPNCNKIRTLIKDIWDARMSKLRTSVDALIREGTYAATLDNLTMMEINTIRPLLPHSLDQLQRIKREHLRTSQSQNTTSLSLNTSSRI